MAKTNSKILERFEPAFDYVEAFTLGFIAIQFLKLWISPGMEDAEKIGQWSGLMAFEFIMVHSGVFMAIMPKKFSLFFFFPIYGLFAFAFNEAIGGGNMVIYIYLFTVFNRMRFAFFNVSEQQKGKVIGKSLYAVMIYFFTLLFVAIGSKLVPEFGLNSEYLARIGYVSKGEGLFLEEPKTAICLGVVYYFLLAIYALPSKYFWSKT